MYHPTRGGTRGGVDQFSWESVKTDKYRENYLGHSVKAPVGRWQKGKDLTWYAKDKKEASDTQKSQASGLRKQELLAIKQAEEDALLAALGHKPVARNVQPLSKEDLADALKRGQTERDDLNVERVEGIGTSVRMQSAMPRKNQEGMTFISPGVGNSSKDKPVTQAASNDDVDKAKKEMVESSIRPHKHKKRKHHKHKESSSDSEEHAVINKDRKSKDLLKEHNHYLRKERDPESDIGHTARHKKRKKKSSKSYKRRSTSPEVSKRHSKHRSNSVSSASDSDSSDAKHRKRHKIHASKHRTRHDSDSD